MDSQVIENFIDQLLGSKAIVNLTPIQKEESVVAFLNANEAKLRQTVFSSDKFPVNNWEAIRVEVLKILGKKILKMIQPRLEKVIDGLKLEWKDKFNNFYVDPEEFKEQIKSLSGKLILRYKARQNFGHILDFIENNALLSYLSSVYKNRRYVYNGLSRFDEVHFEEANSSLDFLYTSVLLLPVFDISLPLKVVVPQYNGSATKMISLTDTENNAILKNSFLHRIKEIINKEFSGVSPDLIEWMMKVQHNPEEIDSIAFSSKIMKIVYYFATSYKKSVRERGAESFDASWFNVARANYKFYAYDYGILDEFYKITIEEDL